MSSEQRKQYADHVLAYRREKEEKEKPPISPGRAAAQAKFLERNKLKDDPSPGSTEAATTPKPAETMFIPLRERKSIAQKLADEGKTLDEIEKHLSSRGVAKVDAKKLAIDAKGRAPEADIIKGTQESVERLAKQIGKNIHVAKVKETGDIVAINDEQKSDPRIDVISSHGPGGSVSDPKNYDRKLDAMEKRRDPDGIVMPSKTIPNEEAKLGDQLGLFGDAVKAPKPTFKPKLLDKPKQGGLFDTKGNPDQMDLFGDGVMPDDMVYKPDQKENEVSGGPKDGDRDENGLVFAAADGIERRIPRRI